MKGVIIEGEYSRLPAELYDDFREDYLNSPLTSNEVRKKYGLSDREYSQLTKPIREELGIKTRPYTTAKHFYLQGKKWQIIKTINGERIFFGSLPSTIFSESDMVEIVETLKNMDWSPILGRKYIEELERDVI